jgi:hypothetical protein
MIRWRKNGGEVLDSGIVTLSFVRVDEAALKLNEDWVSWYHYAIGLRYINDVRGRWQVLVPWIRGSDPKGPSAEISTKMKSCDARLLMVGKIPFVCFRYTYLIH